LSGQHEPIIVGCDYPSNSFYPSHLGTTSRCTQKVNGVSVCRSFSTWNIHNSGDNLLRGCLTDFDDFLAEFFALIVVFNPITPGVEIRQRPA